MAICKLTGNRGAFVESHIIPKGLTKRVDKRFPFIQSVEGERPRRAWSSWKDNELVTRAGEEILAKYDDWAIKELRGQKMIWSGWGPMTGLGSLHDRIPNTEFGIRKVRVSDPGMLRLFYLSLLWRAAASSRPQFEDITMSTEHLERLRLMVMTGNPNPAHFFPIQLVQLSTLGVAHNQTPVASTRTIRSEQNGKDEEEPFFRFYFEGLIAHVLRSVDDEVAAERLGRLLVGNEMEVAMITVTFEESFQKKQLDRVLNYNAENWSHLLKTNWGVTNLSGGK